VQYSHLFDDGGFAGFGCAQEQDLDGGVPDALGHVLEHMVIVNRLKLILLLAHYRRWFRRLLAQTPQKSAFAKRRESKFT